VSYLDLATDRDVDRIRDAMVRMIETRPSDVVHLSSQQKSAVRKLLGSDARPHRRRRSQTLSEIV